MPRIFQSDVLIVGAGPTGAYLGWKLAEAGCKVLALDARPLNAIGADIEVFHMDQVRFDQFEVPHPAGKELLHLVPQNHLWRPDRSTFRWINYAFYVMNMPAFMQRIHGYMRTAGGEIVEGARVEDVIIENGTLKGVKGTLSGEPFEARAAVTVDASGIAGAVRTRLPDGFGVENTPVPPEQTFFCVLELREALPPGCPTGNNTYMGTAGFWNRSYGDGEILGMIAPGSVEAAWEAHRAWREPIYGNPGRLVATRQGCAPYRRAPASLVGNGFIGVGDAVYQNKAFSGEGVTSGMTGCAIAKEVILSALGRGDFTTEGLWEYNARYFTGQGARFAGVMGFYFMINGLPVDELTFLYEHELLYSAADQEYLNLNYELDLPPERWAGVVATLEKGVADGLFSAKSLGMMKMLYAFSGTLKAHYLAYPETPAGLTEWSATTRTLWGY